MAFHSDNRFVASLMKELYVNGGCLPLGKFAKFLNCKKKDALKWVSDHKKYFKIIQEDGHLNDDLTCNILGITQLTLCQKHSSKAGSCQGCNSLHICKFFVMGNDCRFGSSCNFCHDFATNHNKRVLERYNLQQLDVQELKCLFQKLENRCEVTIPVVCKYFNKQKCNKKDCICLHICEYYILNQCMFGKKCKISHDLDSKNINILNIYGIGFTSISDAISKLRILYQSLQDEELKPISDVGIKPALIDNDLICLHNLSVKQCLFKESCRYHHKDLPYQWLYKIMSDEDGSWNDFDSVWNEKIETEFCNLKIQTKITEKKSSVKFYFDTMKCFIAQQECKLHRLSTASFANNPTWLLATTWIWYWKDDNNIWIEYGSNSVNSIDVTNEDIEKSYLENPEGKKIIMIKNKYEVEIDFQKMIQQNGKNRKIIRRPKFVSQEIADQLKQKPSEKMKKLDLEKIPSNWKVPLNLTDISSHYDIQNVDKTSVEFKTVSSEFLSSMPIAIINKIERIQNGNLWEYYNWKKAKMVKENCGKDIKEVNLFHGTGCDSFDAICKQGFDARLSGIRTGTKFGKGIYFAKDASYANNFIDSKNGISKMFMANVLVGEFSKGNPNYVRPPQKNSQEKGGKLFDSCVDNVNNPKLYVIFANEQTYPAYIITFES